MPVKRSIRMKKAPRVGRSKRTKSVRAQWWTSKAAVAGAVVCVATAGMLMAPSRSPIDADRQRKPDTQVPRSDMTTAAESVARSEAVNAPIPSIDPVPAPVDSQPDQKVARVTITGCLERSDEAFRLTDTSGATAPTSRNWKSAFLKKRPATVEVVDTVKRLNLGSHVGRRVTVTGTLVNREMRVGSLQRVASSCSSARKVKA